MSFFFDSSGYASYRSTRKEQQQRYVRRTIAKRKRPCTTVQGGEEHAQCQAMLWNALREAPDVETHLELMLQQQLTAEKVRPDILFRYGGNYIAVEVQRSDLTLDELIECTSAYFKLGIAVIWIYPYILQRFHDERASIRFWLRWVHALCFGRVYAWNVDTAHPLMVTPVHFRSYYAYIPEREWRDEDGEWQGGGGYHKRRPTLVSPVLGKPIHLLQDFVVQQRAAWKSQGRYDIDLPASYLYRDTCEPWWDAEDDAYYAPATRQSVTEAVDHLHQKTRLKGRL